MPKLEGCMIVADGKWRADFTAEKMKSWIEQQHGKFAKAVDESTTHLVVTEDNWKKKSRQVQEANKRIENGQTIRIVSYDWLEDSLVKKSRRAEARYSWPSRDKGKTPAKGNPGRSVRDDNATLMADVVGEETYDAFSAGMKQQKATKNKNTGLKTDARDQDEEVNKFLTGLVNNEAAALLNKKSEHAVNEILRKRYRVYKDEKGFAHNITITKTNCLQNKNRREIFTIYESKEQPDEYALIVRASGTDDVPKTRLLVCLGATWLTVWSQFKKIFKEKTGISWEQRFDLANERERRKRSSKKAPTDEATGYKWDQNLFRVNDLDHSFFQYQPPKFGPGNEESQKTKATETHGADNTTAGMADDFSDIDTPSIPTTMTNDGRTATSTTLPCDDTAVAWPSTSEDTGPHKHNLNIPSGNLVESMQHFSDSASHFPDFPDVNHQNVNGEGLPNGHGANKPGQMHQQESSLEPAHWNTETEDMLMSEYRSEFDDQFFEPEGSIGIGHVTYPDAEFNGNDFVQNGFTTTDHSHEFRAIYDQVDKAGGRTQEAGLSLTKDQEMTTEQSEQASNDHFSVEQSYATTGTTGSDQLARSKAEQPDAVPPEEAGFPGSNEGDGHEEIGGPHGAGKGNNGDTNIEPGAADAEVHSPKEAGTKSTKENDPKRGKNANEDRSENHPKPTSTAAKTAAIVEPSNPDTTNVTADMSQNDSNGSTQEAGLHEVEKATCGSSEDLHVDVMDERAGGIEIGEQNESDADAHSPEDPGTKPNKENGPKKGKKANEHSSENPQTGQAAKLATLRECSEPEMTEVVASSTEALHSDGSTGTDGSQEVDEATGEHSADLQTNDKEKSARGNDLGGQDIMEAGAEMSENTTIETAEENGQHEIENETDVRLESVQAGQADQRVDEDRHDTPNDMEVDGEQPKNARFDSPVKENDPQKAANNNHSDSDSQPTSPKTKRTGDTDLLEPKTKKVKVEVKRESTKKEAMETEEHSHVASANEPLVKGEEVVKGENVVKGEKVAKDEEVVKGEKETTTVTTNLMVIEEEHVISDAPGN